MTSEPACEGLHEEGLVSCVYDEFLTALKRIGAQGGWDTLACEEEDSLS